MLIHTNQYKTFHIVLFIKNHYYFSLSIYFRVLHLAVLIYLTTQPTTTLIHLKNTSNNLKTSLDQEATELIDNINEDM